MHCELQSLCCWVINCPHSLLLCDSKCVCLRVPECVRRQCRHFPPSAEQTEIMAVLCCALWVMKSHDSDTHSVKFWFDHVHASCCCFAHTNKNEFTFSDIKSALQSTMERLSSKQGTHTFFLFVFLGRIQC